MKSLCPTHVQIEILSLNHFLEDTRSSSIQVKIIDKRKRVIVIGLVVPATYMAYKENKSAAEILDKEL